MSVKIRQMLVNPDKYGIKCTYPMDPQFIVVHNTANDASAANEIAYMNRNNSYTSYHFAVDDKEIVQGLPLDRNGWHAGDGAYGAGNRKGIGIEICYSLSGGPKFDQAERNAAWLVAKLLKERGWGIDRVKKHQDFMNKYCPHRTLDYGWDRFLNMIRAELAPQVEWHSWDYPPLVSKIPTVLFELPSKRQIKTLPAGTVISDFVEYTHVDGIAYLRTKYSKDHNKNNGFIETDFMKYEPEVEEKPPKKPETPSGPPKTPSDEEKPKDDTNIVHEPQKPPKEPPVNPNFPRLKKKPENAPVAEELHTNKTKTEESRSNDELPKTGGGWLSFIINLIKQIIKVLMTKKEN